MSMSPLSRSATRLSMMAAAAALLPAAADAPTLRMLDQIEPGQWQLTEVGATTPLRSICVRDARVLLQLRHEGVSCSRYVIADTPGEVTVHYTCPGAGHGRTTIRRETGRLVQIDTQGIAQSAPFSDAIEARRVGACS